MSSVEVSKIGYEAFPTIPSMSDVDAITGIFTRDRARAWKWRLEVELQRSLSRNVDASSESVRAMTSLKSWVEEQEKLYAGQSPASYRIVP